MKKITIKPGAILFIALLAGAIVLMVLITITGEPLLEEEIMIGYQADTVEAEVEYIVERGSVFLGDILQEYQIASIRLLEGEYAGTQLEIDHGRRQIRPEGFQLEAGDRILVTVGQGQDGEIMAFFVDYVRRSSLIVLVLVFVLVSLLVSGWKGLRSLLSIGVSILIIFYFIIPNILRGMNPILISVIGAFVFLAITQYLVYGWTLKTHIAMVGILFAVVFTGTLAVVFVDFSHLSGFGDENAMFLAQQIRTIDIKNLLVASIIIGSLGVLDDLVIGQTSAVMEIYLANPGLSFRQRFRASMNIGRDHVAATVNTLVLAYLGASMGMLLLFSLNQVELYRLINIDYIAEEIVRSLVGTLGLFTAVPVTTAIACWVVDDPERLGKLTGMFGRLTDEYGK